MSLTVNYFTGDGTKIQDMGNSPFLDKLAKPGVTSFIHTMGRSDLKESTGRASVLSVR